MLKKRRNNPDAKRVWFITDTHIGVRNNSNEWMETIADYFRNWFFPLVRKHYRKGDVLVHLGDYFDSRQSISLKALDLGVEIAETMSEIFKDGIYIILGNHDTFNKTTNDVNSLKAIKWIPGIEIYEEPESIQLGDRSFFMMPWRKDHETEKETLASTGKHDFLCCHSDIQGLSFNKYVKIEDGPDCESFTQFDRVYSGHIHYAQNIRNIKMLGCPYELTRSDMDNQKFIILLDLDTKDETIFVNDYSPKFKRFFFSDILEMTPEELEPLFKNNFVDIMIDPVMAIKAPLSILTDTINTQRALKFHPYDTQQLNNLSQQLLDSDGKQFNVLDFISEYVNSMDYDEETKRRIRASLHKLHQLVTSQEQFEKLS